MLICVGSARCLAQGRRGISGPDPGVEATNLKLVCVGELNLRKRQSGTACGGKRGEVVFVGGRGGEGCAAEFPRIRLRNFLGRKQQNKIFGSRLYKRNVAFSTTTIT